MQRHHNHGTRPLPTVPGPHTRHDEPPTSFAAGNLLTCLMRPVRCCSRKLNGTRPEHAPAFRVLHTSDDVAIYPTRTSVSCSGTACACALPLGPRSCSCRGALDAYRDHRAECSTSGVLASGAPPLERAVARVCPEAGAQCRACSHEHGCADRRCAAHRGRLQRPAALARGAACR